MKQSSPSQILISALRRNLCSILRLSLGAGALTTGLAALAYGDDVTYSVPVPADLKQSATFKLKTATIEKTKTATGNDIRLVYQLPPELVGPKPLNIELTGSLLDSAPDRPFAVAGPLAKATCLPQGSSMTCQIQMTNDVTNPQAAQRFLDQSIQDPEKHRQLSEVMTRFSSDPIGVIFYQD